MLVHLEIRDILIIDHVELSFQAGLNILSGETGAGKSILLDSLGLVLGWRLRADLVRQGAEFGEVSAIFEIDPEGEIGTLLEEAGFERAAQIFLRRRNTPDGRKTAWLNDRRVSGELMRSLGQALLELHGQHDDRGLFNPRSHGTILDGYGGHSDALDEVKAAWKVLRDARGAMEALEERAAAARADEEFMRHAMTELDAIDPQPDELETLDQQRRLLQSAQKIQKTLGRVDEALGNNGAEGHVVNAIKWLEGLNDAPSELVNQSTERLSYLLNELSDIQNHLNRFAQEIENDSYGLENIEERLFAIKALARKHNVDANDLPALKQSFEAKLSTLDDFDQHLLTAQTSLSQAQQAYDGQAQILHDARQNAAQALQVAMQDELAPLKMERAQFFVNITKGPPSPTGVDDVRFLAATNPGAPAGPIDKVASGGELSRFLLALKVCLHQESTAQTLIFDEIDRGVGGATADAVGRRLQSLSKNAQILVVTHSPQVAALGDHHWRVEKSGDHTQTRTSTRFLNTEERVEEIARMLSASEVTQAAKDAARDLLGPTKSVGRTPGS